MPCVRALPWPQFKNVKEFYDVRFDMDVNVTVSCVKKRFGREGCARAWFGVNHLHLKRVVNVTGSCIRAGAPMH